MVRGTVRGTVKLMHRRSLLSAITGFVCWLFPSFSRGKINEEQGFHNEHLKAEATMAIARKCAFVDGLPALSIVATAEGTGIEALKRIQMGSLGAMGFKDIAGLIDGKTYCVVEINEETWAALLSCDISDHFHNDGPNCPKCGRPNDHA